MNFFRSKSSEKGKGHEHHPASEDENITRVRGWGDTNTQNRSSRIGSMLSQLFRLNQTELIPLALQSLVRRKWTLTA